MGTGLIYTASGLDRAANQRSDADWVAARLAEPEMRLVPVWRNQNLVNGDAHDAHEGGKQSTVQEIWCQVLMLWRRRRRRRSLFVFSGYYRGTQGARC